MGEGGGAARLGDSIWVERRRARATMKAGHGGPRRRRPAWVAGLRRRLIHPGEGRVSFGRARGSRCLPRLGGAKQRRWRPNGEVGLRCVLWLEDGSKVTRGEFQCS